MKKTDVTHAVMEKVTRFEENRSRRWLTIFLTIVLGIAVLIGVLVLRTYDVLSKQHTLDILEIFYEDKEIIAEFWQDSVAVIIDEMPQQTVFIGLLLCILLVTIWVITRRRRKIVQRRLQELAKRRKKGNNNWVKKGGA